MTLVQVIFVWDDGNGPCDDCGKPAAFSAVDATDCKWCAVCAANHAADGEVIYRLIEDS